MVPARDVLLDAMPVTANGKLDRRALPAPERGRPELAVAYGPAVDELEQAFGQAFAELLDVDRAGRHDNFFELGGSSLLAMKLAERIRGLPGNGGALATTVIFGRPTPVLLAAELRGQSDRAIDATRIARVTDRRAGMADEPIPIVRSEEHFPGATAVECVWPNLCEASDPIPPFSDHT